MELSSLTQLNYSEGRYIVIFNQETGRPYRILNEDFWENNFPVGSYTGDLLDSSGEKIAEVNWGLITAVKFELETLLTEAGETLETEAGEPLEHLVQNWE